MFFPALRRSSKPFERDVEDCEEVTRIVVAAGNESGPLQWSGIATGRTLYLDISPAIFRQLWESASGRDIRKQPVRFEVTLDDHDDLDRLVIDGTSIAPYEEEGQSRTAEKSA